MNTGKKIKIDMVQKSQNLLYSMLYDKGVFHFSRSDSHGARSFG